MPIPMTVDEALTSTIDANIYLLGEVTTQRGKSNGEFRICVGLPFTRSDRKWEFRFLRLHTSRIDKTGEWDDDAQVGWGIERVAISPSTLEFSGDEIAIHIQLKNIGGAVGSVGIAYIDEWPDPNSSGFSGELLMLFSDKKIEWHDLLPSIMTLEYC